jgi:ankyrin repeat protein
MKTQNREIMKSLVHEIKTQSHSTQTLKINIKEAQRLGFDFNTRYYASRTLLHYATIVDACGIISLLIKFGLNPNLCDERYKTPLHMAVELGRYWVIKELLKHNVDINAPGEFEQTPLHLAVINGNLDIVSLLVENGADIELVDEKNQSALDYAIDEKNEQIYNYLKNELKKKEAN